jgi:hypothetical protein
LAAAFFPCSSSLLLRDFEPTPTHRLGQILQVVASQPLGCTGAAGVAAGSAEYGNAELVVHRSHTAEDQRGLGEPAEDVSVAKLELFIATDAPEAALGEGLLATNSRPSANAPPSPRGAVAKRASLVHRAQRGEPVVVVSDPSLVPLLSREAWLSRFLGHGSFAHAPAGLPVKLSMTPRDEVGDDVLARFEAAHEAAVDFAACVPSGVARARRCA